jgi:cell division protein FtsB
MARNRKYRSAAIRFGPALKAFLLCLVIGGAGVGYVWQKTQILELGRQIKQREQRLGTLEQRGEKLKKELATMRTVQALEDSIKRLNLGLSQPQISQVWHVSEPPRDTRAMTNETQYAASAIDH